MPKMTQAEVMETLKAWNKQFEGMLAPLLADDKKTGLVAMRLFYMTRNADGTHSAGNIGLASAPDFAAELIKSILLLLADVEGNRYAGRRETPGKQ